MKFDDYDVICLILLQMSQDVSLYLKETLCNKTFLSLAENIVARNYSPKRY